MLDRVNPWAVLLLLGGWGGVVALIVTGHMSLPGGAGAAVWGLALAFMERVLSKPAVGS